MEGIRQQLEGPGQHHCCLKPRPGCVHGWWVCSKPGIPGGGRERSACMFCEVPGKQSRRYLVPHSGFPDEVELLDPF